MSYAKSARFYDAVYHFKNYAEEAHLVREVAAVYQSAPDEHERKTLLDVACGTGQHLQFWQAEFAAMGLDLEPELLKIARQRCPEMMFVCGDMVHFELDRRFDVVTCLFSAIGYVRTPVRLWRAIQSMARHLKPRGVLIVEPWLSPTAWVPGSPHASFFDQPDLKIARMTISEQFAGEGGQPTSRNDMHFLVATPAGIEYFVERHDLGLFEHEQYVDAFRASGLDVVYDAVGLTGRGLYIGLRDEED